MFKENFIRLCNERGEFPSVVCKNIGITPAAFSKWTDESVPRKATLMRIADYFNVTVDQLLNGDPPKPGKYNRLEVGEITFDLGLFGDVQDPYTPEEQLLIQHWRSRPEAQPFVRKLLDMPEPEAKDADVVS